MDPFDDDLPLDPLLYGFNNYIDESDHDSNQEDDNLPPTPFHYEGIYPGEDNRKKRAPELTRDHRLMIRSLYHLGWTQATIFERRNQLLFPLPDLTMRQIQTACNPENSLMP
jgi:hypothetical protein